MKLWVEMEITFFRISYDISLLSKTTPTKSALMVSGSEIEKLKEHQAVCHLKWNISGKFCHISLFQTFKQKLKMGKGPWLFHFLLEGINRWPMHLYILECMMMYISLNTVYV